MKSIEEAIAAASREVGGAPDESLRRFMLRADSSGLIDVAYATLASPIGELMVAATPAGIVRLSFESEPVDSVLEEVALRISPRILAAPGRVDEARRQLDDYFDGRRSAFELHIDWRLTRGFRRRVLEVTDRIPFGETRSYREVATDVGNPKAVRATGSALGANPIPIVVPCHRVLRSDGSLGGYGGGLSVKRFLLDLERQSPEGD